MIVTIGLHILDICVQHVDEPLPPGQGVCLVDDINISAAGTAAGFAVDVAKLVECECVAVGAVGDDETGNILVGIMSRYGINVNHICRKVNQKTSSTVLPIRKNGERPALHMIGANADLCYDDIPVNVIRSAKFVHIGGFFLMKSFDGPDTIKTLKLAKDSGAITSMDVIGMKCDDMADKILPTMPFLDYFMPNVDEAEMISDLKQIDDIADYFLNAGAGAVVLKMGASGSFLKTKKGLRLRVPAYRVQVVDTTGCGDAWNAGFIACLSKGMSESESALFASACGSLVATGLSSAAGIVSYEEVKRFMENTPTLPCLD